MNTTRDDLAEEARLDRRARNIAAVLWVLVIGILALTSLASLWITDLLGVEGTGARTVVLIALCAFNQYLIAPVLRRLAFRILG